MSAPPLNICLIYDRVYPASIGGAERWYRLLAERLAADGHRVTYLTARHWDQDGAPHIPGVRIVACASQQVVYDSRRRVAPVIAFGLGVARHLFLHGSEYEVVHSSAMLNSAAMASLALSRIRKYKLVLDWWEVWTLPYWQSYVGHCGGIAGWLLQLVLALAPHQPIAHSALHARRLRRLRGRGQAPILRGHLALPGIPNAPTPAEPLVVFLGRHIPEKQVPAIVPALAIARKRLPHLRATLFGAGPDTPGVQSAVSKANLCSVVDLPGFAREEIVRETLRRALCLILLSRREGYALVIAEAATLGVPSIVLRHPDSAAAELIVDSVNGILCDSVDPAIVASAILRIYDAGDGLRQSTLAWSRDHATELSLAGSLPRLLALYRGESASEGPVSQA